MENMVENACYYIQIKDRFDKKQKAILYDLYGEKLKEIELTQEECYNNKIPRIEKMLDPGFKGKARPDRIELIDDIIKGKILYFYDKNNNIIYEKKYKSSIMNMEEIIKSLKNNDLMNED